MNSVSCFDKNDNMTCQLFPRSLIFEMPTSASLFPRWGMAGKRKHKNNRKQQVRRVN